MATRSLRVEFVQDDLANEITAPPEVHDISVDDSAPGVPQVIENPHVDFPGTWALIGEGEGGTYRYGRQSQVADTANTVAL